MNFKAEITKLHYDSSPHGFVFVFLKILSIFYGFGSGFKNFLYDTKILIPQKVNAFVVSIGNFTTGGVGKTPVVAEIAKYFIRKGEKTAVISRGFGGKLNNKSVNLISDGESIFFNAEQAGDEPYWHAANIKGCIVLTCSDRVKAAEYAIKNFGVSRIILDDGFQHRKIHRDLDIVLADSEKLFGNGCLLPAGPLRESLKGFKRADKLVIVSKNVNHDTAEKLADIMDKKYMQQDGKFKRKQSEKLCRSTLLCRIEPDYVYNIQSGELLPKGSKAAAISAIGQPEQFYKFIEKDYEITECLTFDDHRRYTEDDIKNIKGNIITTEKDGVKLALLNRTDIYALKLKTTIDIVSLFGI